MNIELLLVICVSIFIFIGMLIEHKVKLDNKVEVRDYDILLNKYESLKTELNEKLYIGATYTNGYLDVIVLNFDKDTVWYVSNKNTINYLDRELFTDQFILKEE